MKSTFKGIFQFLGIPIYWLRQNSAEFAAAAVRIWALLPFQSWRIRRLLRNPPVRLNFGCGDAPRSGWIGIDRYFGENVQIVLDLRRPLPLPNSCADLCYSEHFLEHLTPE